MVASIMPQTFLFPIAEWTKATAKAWLVSNGYRHDKLEREGEHIRARQFEPRACDRGTYGTKTWWSRRDAAGKGRRKPKKILAVYCQRSFER